MKRKIAKWRILVMFPMKTERELTELLEKLISRWEDEVIEFKRGGARHGIDSK